MTQAELRALIKECLTEVLVEARRICSWCKKDLGQFTGDKDSHGICPECKEKMMADIRKQNPNPQDSPQVP